LIADTFAGIVISVKLSQLENAYVPSEVSDEGSDTPVNETQPSNASEPMFFSLELKSTFVRDLHPLKANAPMDVTPEGSLTEVSPVFANA
jgi:hypothetical protein